MTPDNIGIEKLYQTLKDEGLTVALSNSEKIKRNRKKVSKGAMLRGWADPTDYKGYNDPEYPTGLLCSWIPSLKLQLIVIDLDKPKNPDDIPIDVLKTVCMKLINRTYTTQTPSGGYHIYLLSRRKPIESQPDINIDYQTNTGRRRGKYVAKSWIWDNKGIGKLYYNKVWESPDSVLIVDDGDDVLNRLIETLKQNGHIKTSREEHQDKIVNILSKYYQKGSRDDYSLRIAGFLRKEGFTIDATRRIIQEVFKNDEEIGKRLQNTKQTYQKDINQIEGWKWLKERLTPQDAEELSNLTRETSGTVKKTIIRTLSKNREPSKKILGDYMNNHLKLYKNLETLKYYERQENGSIKEIDDRRIIKFFNKHFGVNSISSKRCRQVLDQITRPIKKNYDLIEFKNGILNTKTHTFHEDKSQFNETPKIDINLKWNPEAKPGRIGEIIDKILDSEYHPDDKERFLRSVGHAFHGTNRIGKITLIVGRPGTGKSTLTTILKRVFNHSTVPTYQIVRNERFTLHSMVDKDINIDDDINSGILRDIGNLLSITTGDGLEVEIKGENRKIQCQNEQIPRLFANGNTFPPILGADAFERRLLLIHADNKIKYEDKDEYLRADLLNGEYDNNGIEWFIHTTITEYWEHENEPITTEQDEKDMMREYEFKSYPLKRCIEELFKDSYRQSDYLTVSEVNLHIKAWHKLAKKNGLIMGKHSIPSTHQIKKTMANMGYDQTLKRDIGRVYMDIKIREEWKIYNDVMRQPTEKAQKLSKIIKEMKSGG